MSATAFWGILALVFFYGSSPGFSQDSTQNRFRKAISQTLGGLAKGVAAADYKKGSPIEFFPSTALALPQVYLPLNTNHPRLISSQDLTQAAANLAFSPQREWYLLLRQRVNRYLGMEIRLAEPVSQQAEDFKNLAFVYHIEKDKRYLQALRTLFRQLPEPPVAVNFEVGANDSGWGDFLLSAQALIPIAVALDLTYNDIEPGLRQEVLRKIMTIAGQLENALTYAGYNNHGIVFACAVMVAAMLADGTGGVNSIDRQGLWQNGLIYLSRGLGLIAPDGGYAEGVYYARFILSYLAPLAVYVENITGIRFFEHPYLERLVNWVIANDKGSGRHSAFDDAFQTGAFFLPPIISQSRKPQNWQAYLQAQPPRANVKTNLVEGICRYPNLPPLTETAEKPVQFFMTSGQAIFRDQALQPQFFASILAEQEAWFADRHEHIDPFNLEISAYGADFIVDGGYGNGVNDINRRWFTSAQANNGILVDGLGTNKNPIYGDPAQADIEYAYQLPYTSAFAMSHFIGDVQLTRQAFFINRRYLLLLDDFQSATAHDISLNFNITGNLRRLHSRQLQLQNGNAALNIISLSSPATSPVITENFGIYTPPGRPAPLGSVQIRQLGHESGHFMTLFAPTETTTPLRLISKSIQGKGERWQFADTENNYELAINRGQVLKTARWQSDAKAILLVYTPDGRLNSLLLSDATEFKTDEFAWRSDLPLTLFLEKQNDGWQGFIHNAPEQLYQITFNNLSGMPLRFGRLPVSPLYLSGESAAYTLQSSGPIESGVHCSAVDIPYVFHPGPSFIRWLNTHAASPRDFSYWPGYRRQLFENEIAENIYTGFRAGMENRSQAWFGNADVLQNAFFITNGLAQESYDRDAASTFTIRLPHRYHFTKSVGGTQFDFFEDGIFSLNQIRIRNARTRVRWTNGGLIRYQFSNWFEGHLSHEVQLAGSRGHRLFYQSASSSVGDTRSVSGWLPGKKWVINPGYRWHNNEAAFKEAYLNWQIKTFQGSIFNARKSGTEEWRQSLRGFGNRWSFAADGWQGNGQLSQRYAADWHYQLHPAFSFSQGGDLQKSGTWTIPRVYTDLYWQQRHWHVRSHFMRDTLQSTQALAFYTRHHAHAFDANIDLTNWQLGKENRVETRWQYAPNSLFRNALSTQYYYNPVAGNYGVMFLNQLSIAAASGYVWQPLTGFFLPEARPLEWIGSAVSYIFGRSRLRQGAFFAQIIANTRQQPALLDYQFALQKKDRFFPDIWLQFRRQGNRFLNSEIRLSQTRSGRRQGIYYAYHRNSGSRLEGFLSWHW